MESPIKTTPKDVFLHLLLIATLYMSVVSFITLLWQYINVLFPDPLDFNHYRALDAVRFGASALIIAFPAFLFLSWIIGKDFAKHPEKHETRIRKWLMYFTLFASAVTVLVDLVILVYNFLGGDLTTRFFLKAFVILAVVAGVFAYYFWDIRRDVRSATNLPVTLRWLTSGIMLAAVIGTFFVIGTPSTQRDIRFDERRLNDLQMVQGQIVDYWMRTRTVPETLADFKNDLSDFTAPNDPEFGTPYEYRKTGDLSFELCAVFAVDSNRFSGSKGVYSMPYYPGPGVSENWEHGQGKTCFERTIDPKFYEPIKPVEVPPTIVR